VLTDLGAKNVKVQAKADKTPRQFWYIAGGSFICASFLIILTVTGKTEDTLTLNSWVPGDTRQQFTCFDKGIIHKASGLVLVTNDSLSITTIVLADLTVLVLASLNKQWTIPPGSDNLSSGFNNTFSALSSLKANFAYVTTKAKTVTKRSTQLALTQLALTGQTSVLGNFVCDLTAAGLITYVVTIITLNNLAFNTDNYVKISFFNRYLKCLDPVKLKTSITYSDPFKTSYSNRFILVNLEDISQITNIIIKKSKKGWFFKDN
jgi:hypothetical protein